MRNKKEYIWSLVGRFIPQATYLVTTMILARFLTPEDFGAIGVLTIFFTIANTLMDAGLGGSLVKEKSITRTDCSTIATFNVTMSLVMYLILFFSAGTIEHHYDSEGLAVVTKIICLIFVINSIGHVPRSLLIRELRFKTLSTISIVSVSVAAVVAVVMAVLGTGIWSLVAYQLVSASIGVLMSIVAAKYKIAFQFSYDSFKRLFSFGIFTTLTTIIDTIYENLIVNIFGKSFSIQQAGYLSQAKKIEEAPSTTLTHTISNVSFPILTKLREDNDKFNYECKSIFSYVQMPLLPLLACISLFAAPILHLVFGSQWVAAAPYLSMLILAGIFRMAETLNRTFIKATTIVDKLFVYTIIKRVIGIGILIVCLLVDKNTVLAGYVVSTLVGFIINAILLARISTVRFWEQVWLFIKISIPTIIFYLIVWLFVKNVDFLWIQISFTILLLIIYYIMVLPLYGLNTTSIIKKFLSRKKNFNE